MVKGCGPRCAKYFLFVLNVLFFVAGGVILGVGIWARVDSALIATKVPSVGDALGTKALVHTAAAIFIAFGAFVFVVGFLGCCGALRDSRCLLGFYIAFIVVVIIGELAAGIFAVVNFKDVLPRLEVEAVKDLKDKYPNSTLLTATIFVEYRCCGWNSYRDFENSTYTRKSRNAVPPECCRSVANVDLQTCLDEAKSHATNATNLVTIGCAQSIAQDLKPVANIMIGIAAGIAVLELIVLVAAILLCVSVEH